MIANNGGKSVTAAQGVATSRRGANDVLAGGSMVNSDQHVYAIQLTGDFIGYSASAPAGSDLPTGHVLVFFVDADTNTILDWGITEKPADISKLGSPFDLDISAE
jgi:hypothetical protein